MPSALYAQRPDAPEAPDRYVIDVAALVRDGTARTISDVLISRIPGLLLVPGSGLNGSGTRIRLAGVRSLIADSPPLVFLDGMRIDAREDDSQLVGGPGPSRLDDIPIEDVQTIEVLRGPASTARYGWGAAAGVILIRSREGRSGAVRVEGFVQGTLRGLPTGFPANYGGVDADNPNVAYQNGSCHLAAHASGACVQDYVRSFNPLVDRSPFSTAPRRQLGLTATGGPRWGAFRVSGSLEGDAAAYSVPAVTWNDDYRNWNIRASGLLHPVPQLDVVTQVARTSSNLRLPLYGPVLSALLGPSDSAAFSWDPLFQNAGRGIQEVDRTQLGLEVRATPRPWLGVHALLGLDDIDQRERALVPGSRITGERAGRNRTIALNATASAIRWGRLRLTTTVGLEHLSQRDDAEAEQVWPDTATACGVGATMCRTLEARGRLKVFGIYAVEQVGISDRVFVTGSLRHDAIDAFDEWSTTHPGLALDWIARPAQPGPLGKVAIRAAYGSASQRLTIAETFVISPFPPTPRPALKRDRTRALELSAEASGWGDRWRAQASLYDLRSDAIAFLGSPSGGGPPVPSYASGAVISNRGIAATVSASLVDRASWGWDMRLSLWGNRNRLVKHPRIFLLLLYNGTTGQGESVGFPVHGYWARPMGFADANGDGIIDVSEITGDFGPFAWGGTPYPTQGAALTSSWRLARRWRLAAMIDYRAGHTLFNEIRNLRCQVARCRERHDPATSLADQADAMAANIRPLGYFEDADYLKLRELAIAFDVPATVATALGARAATITLGGRDLATWTRYSGADPENGSYALNRGGTPMAIGDFATVPVPHSWTLRVKVSY